MIGSRKPREIKPGDLYVVTGDGAVAEIQDLEIGDVVTMFGIPGTWRMKLLDRHECGALEFLVMSYVDADRRMPVC